jgi:hypothetical protein
LNEEEREFLQDLIVDTSQALEMANIYTNILSSTMDAFASIISNNLNSVMKRLTSITIILSLPILVTSIYGMNVEHIPYVKFSLFILYSDRTLHWDLSDHQLVFHEEKMVLTMALFNVRVYGLLFDEKNRLLVSDEFIRGNYFTKLPGGGLEFGEGTRDCLKERIHGRNRIDH